MSTAWRMRYDKVIQDLEAGIQVPPEILLSLLRVIGPPRKKSEKDAELLGIFGYLSVVARRDGVSFYDVLKKFHKKLQNTPPEDLSVAERTLVNKDFRLVYDQFKKLKARRKKSQKLIQKS